MFGDHDKIIYSVMEECTLDEKVFISIALAQKWDPLLAHIRKGERPSAITSLILNSHNIQEIPRYLQCFINLKTIDFCSNKITKIENLQNLNALTSLYLYGNNIAVIENLSNLYVLTTLNLHKNNIKKIENLNNLNSLLTLNLGENQIKKIQNLQNLHLLTTLNLEKNKIRKIQNLENLKKLTTLNLDYNEIIKIQNLHQIKTLYLNSNQINIIENIEKINGLQSLYLRNNKIKIITSIKNPSSLNFVSLRSLCQLYLSNNIVTSFEGILHFQIPNLNKLVCNSNKISNIRALRRINSPNLEVFWINQKYMNLNSLSELHSKRFNQFNFDNRQLDSQKCLFLFKMQSSSKQFEEIKKEKILLLMGKKIEEKQKADDF